MITKKEVQHIAKLARISLSEKEIEKFSADLNKVLGYIEVLKSVDTEGVEPLAQVTGLENVFRDDRAHPSDVTEAIIKNAPDQRGRFIRVKGVFE
ncbi:MAG: Glutamyl-tRNA(Gln) amidotransferase subunit C [Parcubacteria group bacterium GW2011_GWA2_51_12]|nr:MAG: Glutamyl-tRNA(Gln) amidotransferase subunit C [Parcubacteria group bacterium GW2011_GWA2_51_12]